MKKIVLAGMVAGFSLLGMSNGALAAMDYDFNGAFTKDNDVLQVNFTIDTERDITFFTSSWDDGGFDPVLTLWDSAGDFIIDWDDSAQDNKTALSNGVSYSYGFSDVYYVRTLAAGSYSATITQWDNYANGPNLVDGFYYDTEPHFTYVMGFGDQPDFNGATAAVDPRTENLAFHILNVSTAEVNTVNPVPVPASLLLFGSALAGLIGIKRRK